MFIYFLLFPIVEFFVQEQNFRLKKKKLSPFFFLLLFSGARLYIDLIEQPLKNSSKLVKTNK